MNKLIVSAGLVAGLTWLSVQGAPKLALTKDDTVVVRADEAWEEPHQEIAHFRGNFQLQAPDWSVVGDSAVLYGALEDPDRVEVEGQPALIWLLKADAAGKVEGQGRRIEYHRASDRITLTGDARLADGKNTLVSGLIEYDIGADRFSAGDAEGVEVIVEPQRNGD